MDGRRRTYGPLRDPDAQAIIDARRPIVEQHLARWRTSPDAAFIDPALDLATWFTTLEQTVSDHVASQQVERSRGRTAWREQFLLPLARDLDLVAPVEAQIFHQLHRTGAFDPIVRRRDLRPEHDATYQTVRTVFEHASFHTHRVTGLLEQHLCRDTDSAERVVSAWENTQQQAAARARGIVLAYATYGDVGLLTGSSYQHTDELLLLQRHLLEIEETGTPPEVGAVVQADLLTLMLAWQRSGQPHWSIRLLNEPPRSALRKTLQQSFGARRHDNVIQVMVEQFDYEHDEAAALLAHLLDTGLKGVIAYRINPANSAAALLRYEQARLDKVLRAIYGALPDGDFRVISAMSTNILRAMHETGVVFPLIALLTEQPSSGRRKRVSRQFSFGLAAIIRRRQGKKKHIYRTAHGQHLHTPKRRSGPRPSTAFVKAVAASSILTENDATARLRDLITYGGIGLLPRWQRAACLDPRLLSWLRLIRYGRLEGRIFWPDLMAQLTRYCQELDLAPPSLLVTQALFNALPRPAFWNGGQGEAVAQLRQRFDAVHDSVPRLHDRWVVASTRFPLGLCDTTGRPLCTTSFLTMVIDANGHFPLAVWPSCAAPTPQDMALALYCAIWHFGAENWPIKGIPEQLVIAADPNSGDWSDLRRAARYLLCDITIQPPSAILDKTHRLLLQQAEQEGAWTVQQALAANERTVGRVRHGLEEWVTETFFPYHRAAPVWASIAQHGVVMPGHDTPAAGWLLPVSGQGIIRDGSIEFEGRRYRHDEDTHQPEYKATIRSFPDLLIHPSGYSAAQGVFVESLRTTTTKTVWFVSERR